MAALAAPAATAAPAKTDGKKRAPELYELRTIRVRIGAQHKLVGDFLGEVAIPAMARAGVGPVGVFELTFGGEMPCYTLLIPHESPASVVNLAARLAADPAYIKGAAATAYHGATAAQPAFGRMDSSLLQAFDNIPRLEAPEKKPRIFELRTYESPSEAASVKKMEMFTKLGELEIFRRVGLTPVFFARTLIGPRQPSFVYMLTYPDLAARDKAWATFRADPEWLKLKATPGYTDPEIMSNIGDLILRPTAYSQI